MDNPLGKNIGKYVVEEEIGRGGMAVVYRARQVSMNRDVAIKVIHASMATDPNFNARFEREIHIIASLEHPYILPVIDFGRENDSAYLVMRFLKGGNLQQLLKNGPLELAYGAKLFTQVASALTYAHSKGIIHRDLKPSNVLLDDQGNGYLTDFGIAKILTTETNLTSTGTLIGTPEYMSPEQWRGDANHPVDDRADIYALGVMLYRMLAGQLPFVADTPYQLMAKHLTQMPPPMSNIRPDMPQALDRVIFKAMDKAPEKRFSSPDEIAEAINQVLASNTGRRSSRRSTSGTKVPLAMARPDPEMEPTFTPGTGGTQRPATPRPKTPTPRPISRPITAPMAFSSAGMAPPRSKVPIIAGIVGGVVVILVVGALVIVPKLNSGGSSPTPPTAPTLNSGFGGTLNTGTPVAAAVNATSTTGRVVLVVPDNNTSTLLPTVTATNTSTTTTVPTTSVPPVTTNSVVAVVPSSTSVPPTATLSPTHAPTLTNTASPLPLPSATALPSKTPTNMASPTTAASATPLPTQTPAPTTTPSPLPTNTTVPTNTPTPKPTATPTATDTPTELPTATPTSMPTETPIPPTETLDLKQLANQLATQTAQALQESNTAVAQSTLTKNSSLIDAALKKAPIYMTNSGFITHNGNDAPSFSPLKLKQENFYLHIEYVNPYSAADHAWDDGLLFRLGTDKIYALAINSSKHWILFYRSLDQSGNPQTKTVAEGDTDAIRTGANEINAIELTAYNSIGVLSVNGTIISSSLDLSGNTVAGDLAAVIGLTQGDQKAGSRTKFQNFKIYALP